jgi:hypothetical protein
VVAFSGDAVGGPWGGDLGVGCCGCAPCAASGRRAAGGNIGASPSLAKAVTTLLAAARRLVMSSLVVPMSSVSSFWDAEIRTS